MSNPFSPGFGKVPEIYLGRENDVKKVVEGLENPSSPYQTTLVYGMRGSGKTAFLTDVSREIEKRKDWIVADLVMGTPMIQNLVDTIYIKAKSQISKFLDSLNGVSISALGITISASRKESAAQYQTLLLQLLEELKRKGIRVLITIDEVTGSKELRELASIYQVCLRRNYNVALIMAGLPQNVSELQNDKVLTFLLRASRVTMSPIDLWLIKDSYAKAFSANRSISEDNLLQIAKLTCGYAYGFQLLGYYLWEDSADTGKITDEVIHRALISYKTDLYRNAYVKIYQSLTKVERDFVNVMADSEEIPVPFRKIVEGMDKPKNYVSTYRLRLLDTQVISAPARGYLSFTLPFFRDFVLETRELMDGLI